MGLPVFSGISRLFNLGGQNSDALIIEQHGIMARQLPSQYTAAIISLVCLMAVNIETAPSLLAVYIPLVLIVLGIFRFRYWYKANRILDSFSMEKRKKDIRKVVILAPLLTTINTILAVQLMQYGDTTQQALTLVLAWGTVAISCYSMSAVPGAAMSAMLVSNIPLAIGFFLSRDYTVSVIGLGLIGFSALSLLVMYNSYTVIQNLVRTRADLLNRHREVNWLANTDTLTGLANRNNFNERLQCRIDCNSADDNTFAVIVLDLDSFKQINNLFSHQGGDEILNEVGARLVKLMGDRGVVSRLSSDEFHLIIDNVDDEQQAQEIGMCLHSALEEPFKIQDKEVHISTSIGVALYPEAGKDAADLIKHAVQAQNKAKFEGGGKTLIFSKVFEEEILESSCLELALKAAIRNDEIEVYFQPIVDLRTGRFVSFETLARWSHPELGFVSPDVFIRLAEEKGLIEALTINLLRKATAVAASWPEDIMLSFNLSAEQVCNPNFSLILLGILNESGLAPNRFDVELTETAIMMDMEKALVSIRNMREIGICISLDDFGTGYSSLSQIRHFPLDKLKIDKSFTDDICASKKMENMTRAIISMCTVLELKTVSEGIETTKQLRILQETGCNLGQGYLFCKPLAADCLPNKFVYGPLAHAYSQQKNAA